MRGNFRQVEDLARLTSQIKCAVTAVGDPANAAVSFPDPIKPPAQGLASARRRPPWRLPTGPGAFRPGNPLQPPQIKVGALPDGTSLVGSDGILKNPLQPSPTRVPFTPPGQPQGRPFDPAQMTPENRFDMEQTKANIGRLARFRLGTSTPQEKAFATQAGWTPDSAAAMEHTARQRLQWHNLQGHAAGPPPNATIPDLPKLDERQQGALWGFDPEIVDMAAARADRLAQRDLPPERRTIDPSLSEADWKLTNLETPSVRQGDQIPDLVPRDGRAARLLGPVLSSMANSANRLVQGEFDLLPHTTTGALQRTGELAEGLRSGIRSLPGGQTIDEKAIGPIAGLGNRALGATTDAIGALGEGYNIIANRGDDDLGRLSWEGLGARLRGVGRALNPAQTYWNNPNNTGAGSSQDIDQQREQVFRERGLQSSNPAERQRAAESIRSNRSWQTVPTAGALLAGIAANRFLPGPAAAASPLARATGAMGNAAGRAAARVAPGATAAAASVGSALSKAMPSGFGLMTPVYRGATAGLRQVGERFPSTKPVLSSIADAADAVQRNPLTSALDTVHSMGVDSSDERQAVMDNANEVLKQRDQFAAGQQGIDPAARLQPEFSVPGISDSSTFLRLHEKVNRGGMESLSPRERSEYQAFVSEGVRSMLGVDPARRRIQGLDQSVSPSMQTDRALDQRDVESIRQEKYPGLPRDRGEQFARAEHSIRQMDDQLTNMRRLQASDPQAVSQEQVEAFENDLARRRQDLAQAAGDADPVGPLPGLDNDQAREYRDLKSRQATGQLSDDERRTFADLDGRVASTTARDAATSFITDPSTNFTPKQREAMDRIRSEKGPDALLDDTARERIDGAFGKLQSAVSDPGGIDLSKPNPEIESALSTAARAYQIRTGKDPAELIARVTQDQRLTPGEIQEFLTETRPGRTFLDQAGGVMSDAVAKFRELDPMAQGLLAIGLPLGILAMGGMGSSGAMGGFGGMASLFLMLMGALGIGGAFRDPSNPIGGAGQLLQAGLGKARGLADRVGGMFSGGEQAAPAAADAPAREPSMWARLTDPNAMLVSKDQARQARGLIDNVIRAPQGDLPAIARSLDRAKEPLWEQVKSNPQVIRSLRDIAREDITKLPQGGGLGGLASLAGSYLGLTSPEGALRSQFMMNKIPPDLRQYIAGLSDADVERLMRIAQGGR